MEGRNTIHVDPEQLHPLSPINHQRVWETHLGVFFEYAKEVETFAYANLDVEIITLKEYDNSTEEKENTLQNLCSNETSIDNYRRIKGGNSSQRKDSTGMYQCSLCSKRYPTPSNLRRHVHLHHPSQYGQVYPSIKRPTVYRCHICYKGFDRRYYVQRHLTKCHPRVRCQKIMDVNMHGRINSDDYNDNNTNIEDNNNNINDNNISNYHGSNSNCKKNSNIINSSSSSSCCEDYNTANKVNDNNNNRINSDNDGVEINGNTITTSNNNNNNTQNYSRSNCNGNKHDNSNIRKNNSTVLIKSDYDIDVTCKRHLLRDDITSKSQRMICDSTAALQGQQQKDNIQEEKENMLESISFREQSLDLENIDLCERDGKAENSLIDKINGSNINNGITKSESINIRVERSQKGCNFWRIKSNMGTDFIVNSEIRRTVLCEHDERMKEGTKFMERVKRNCGSCPQACHSCVSCYNPSNDTHKISLAASIYQHSSGCMKGNTANSSNNVCSEGNIGGEKGSSQNNKSRSNSPKFSSCANTNNSANFKAPRKEYRSKSSMKTTCKICTPVINNAKAGRQFEQGVTNDPQIGNAISKKVVCSICLKRFSHNYTLRLHFIYRHCRSFKIELINMASNESFPVQKTIGKENCLNVDRVCNGVNKPVTKLGNPKNSGGNQFQEKMIFGEGSIFSKPFEVEEVEDEEEVDKEEKEEEEEEGEEEEEQEERNNTIEVIENGNQEGLADPIQQGTNIDTHSTNSGVYESSALRVRNRNSNVEPCEGSVPNIEDVNSNLEEITHPVNQTVIYKCMICQAVLQRRKNAQRHVRTHFPARFSCNVCKKQFQRREKLRVHIERGHCTPIAAVEDTSYSKSKRERSCNGCKKVYYDASTLRKHMKTCRACLETSRESSTSF